MRGVEFSKGNTAFFAFFRAHISSAYRSSGIMHTLFSDGVLNAARILLLLTLNFVRAYEY